MARLDYVMYLAYDSIMTICASEDIGTLIGSHAERAFGRSVIDFRPPSYSL